MIPNISFNQTQARLKNVLGFLKNLRPQTSPLKEKNIVFKSADTKEKKPKSLFKGFAVKIAKLFLIFILAVVFYILQWGNGELLAICSFILTFAVIYDFTFLKNIIDYEFLTGKKPTGLLRLFYKCLSTVEVIFQAALMAVMSLFLFGGNDGWRSFETFFMFSFCVIIAYYLIKFLSKRLTIDATRYAYFRVSIVVGIIFSIGLGEISGLGVLSLGTILTKDFFNVYEWDLAKGIDVAYSLMFHADAFIEKVLKIILGSFWGYAVSLMISSQIIYGFLVVIYAIGLWRVLRRVDQFFNTKKSWYNPESIEDLANGEPTSWRDLWKFRHQSPNPIPVMVPTRDAEIE